MNSEIGRSLQEALDQYRLTRARTQLLLRSGNRQDIVDLFDISIAAAMSLDEELYSEFESMAECIASYIASIYNTLSEGAREELRTCRMTYQEVEGATRFRELSHFFAGVEGVDAKVAEDLSSFAQEIFCGDGSRREHWYFILVKANEILKDLHVDIFIDMRPETISLYRIAVARRRIN